MTTSERIAIAWTPLFLRLALAVTFLWAGSIKVLHEMELNAERAAALRAMGLNLPAPAAAAPAQPAPQAPTPAPGLDKPLPVPEGSPGVPPAGDGKKADKPASKAKPSPLKPGGPAARAVPMVETDVALAADPTLNIPAAAGTTRTVSMRQGAAAESAPGTIKVRRLYGLALLIEGAAKKPTEPGRKQLALWPGVLASGNRPLILAWAVAITELLGGGLVLIGLFTRLSALGLACCMAGALWLTEIGPAIQSGTALLGFLPNYAAADTKMWTTPLWQFGLLMSALALVCAGAGAASIDRTLKAPPTGGGGGAAAGGGVAKA